jgi:plasmid stability protein
MEEDVKARLKRRAERHGRNMEEEGRKIGLKEDLPELRGQSPKPADFAK